MTQTEALQEARKRWGVNGQAWRKNRRPNSKNPIHETTRYFVSGFAKADIGDRKYGTGDSWELAFADADKHASASVIDVYLINDAMRTHEQEIKNARSPSDVADAAYKAVNTVKSILGMWEGVATK